MTSHTESSVHVSVVATGNDAPVVTRHIEVTCDGTKTVLTDVNGVVPVHEQQPESKDLPVAVASDAARDEENNNNDNNNDDDIAASCGEAAALYAMAEAGVAKGLPKCNDWFRARDFFNEAGALYATVGHPDEAAKSFLQASVITNAFKSEDETVLALSLAADNLQMARPVMAVDVLNSLATTFKNAGYTMQAARCKREAALLLDHRLKEPVKAIQMYKDAMELYGNRAITKSFTRQCMSRICALTVGLEEYTEASRLFMDEAAMIHRHFPKTRPYLYALLCLLAEGYGGDDRYFDALYITRKRFDELQEEEINLQQGKECKLMRQIIDANDHGSLNEFDIAVFTYKSCSTYEPDPVFDALIAKCRSNLYNHVEQYM